MGLVGRFMRLSDTNVDDLHILMVGLRGGVNLELTGVWHVQLSVDVELRIRARRDCTFLMADSSLGGCHPSKEGEAFILSMFKNPSCLKALLYTSSCQFQCPAQALQVRCPNHLPYQYNLHPYPSSQQTCQHYHHFCVSERFPCP